jgi:hypothetical protein
MCHERWVQLGDEGVERGWLRRLYDRQCDDAPRPDARTDEPVAEPQPEKLPEREPPVMV